MNDKQKQKRNKRIHDRKWFKKHLPESYMSKYTIHHEWDLGETTYLVTYEEHIIITKKERKNENI